MSFIDWFSGKCFGFVHGNNLVYNTCWEDPRLDRVALEVGPKDNILVITSAGCNALDYCLVSPEHVFAVDMNPRQNALLQLKCAAIRSLEYEDFFKMFGKGRLPGFERIYKSTLRSQLEPWSQGYWDRHTNFFDGKNSFFFRGSSGSVAKFCNHYIDKVGKIRPDVDAMLSAKTLEEQRAIYERSVKPAFWTGFMKRVMGSDATLSMLGVPRAQRQQVEKHFGGGISEFIEDCLQTVFTKLPLADNYFWRVYLTGEYTMDCCPEYVSEAGFAKLKGGLVDKVSTHTTSVEQFLKDHKGAPITRFILLDHMDWLSTYRYAWLESEWQAIVEKAAPTSRVLYRSGGMKVDYVDPVRVTVNGKQRRVGELVKYNTKLAEELHVKDRVHTYGSFYIADMTLA